MTQLSLGGFAFREEGAVKGPSACLGQRGGEDERQGGSPHPLAQRQNPPASGTAAFTPPGSSFTGSASCWPLNSDPRSCQTQDSTQGVLSWAAGEVILLENASRGAEPPLRRRNLPLSVSRTRDCTKPSQRTLIAAKKYFWTSVLRLAVLFEKFAQKTLLFLTFFFTSYSLKIGRCYSVAQSCPTLCDPRDCSPPWRFSRQEYWSGLPCPPLGDLPNPGTEPRPPALQADSLPSEPAGKPFSTWCYNESVHQVGQLTRRALQWTQYLELLAMYHHTVRW